MNVKNNVKEWKEPWKKKEAGARLSEKALRDQNVIQKQRNRMEKAASQNVRIICHDLMLFPGLFKTFTVKVRIPLRKAEIDERMKAAFPELKWGDS